MDLQTATWLMILGLIAVLIPVAKSQLKKSRLEKEQEAKLLEIFRGKQFILSILDKSRLTDKFETIVAHRLLSLGAIVRVAPVEELRDNEFALCGTFAKEYFNARITFEIDFQLIASHQSEKQTVGRGLFSAGYDEDGLARNMLLYLAGRLSKSTTDSPSA